MLVKTSVLLVLVVLIGITLAQYSKPSGKSQFGQSNGESQKNCPTKEEVKFCREVVQKLKSGICKPQNDNLVKSGSRQQSSWSSSLEKSEGNKAGGTAALNNTELQDDLSFESIGEDEDEDSVFDGSLNDLLFDAVNEDVMRGGRLNSTISTSGHGIGKPKPQRRPNFSLLPNGTWGKVSKTHVEPIKIRPYY